ncbi:hypothetical protein HDU89_002143 [Geranomyces variabilis]|nr:hypothetical protein HDU89_002143 [Geranomyces variabilis]
MSITVIWCFSGMVTLVWRSRVTERRLWNVELASFDMYILWSACGFGISGAFYFFMMAYNYEPISSRPAFMFTLQCIPWVIGRSALWILTFSMLRNTPRTAVSVKLPSIEYSDFMLRGFIIAELLTTAPLSLAAGITMEKGRFDAYFILNAILNTAHMVQALTLATAMWYFGGQMVRIAQENRMEMRSQGGVDGLANVGNLDAKLGKAILKMQITNLAAQLSLGWYSLMLVIYAHVPDWSMSIKWWSLFQCISGYVFVPAMFWASQTVILWAEFKPKEVPNDMIGILNVMRERRKPRLSSLFRARLDSGGKANGGGNCGTDGDADGEFDAAPNQLTPPETSFPLTVDEEAARPMLSGDDSTRTSTWTHRSPAVVTP